MNGRDDETPSFLLENLYYHLINFKKLCIGTIVGMILVTLRSLVGVIS